MTFKFSPEQVAKLEKKLDGSVVKTRDQAGRSLSYIEAWHAIAEANRIFGFDGWSRETISITKIAEVQRKVGKTNPKDGWGVGYMAKVRVTIGDIVREGTGCGSGVDVDLVAAHESAVKEAESDAMKRALMTFGNPFGLALYDKTRENVDHSPDPSQIEGEVADSVAWIVAQTDAGEINKAWSRNLDWFLGLPEGAQKRVTEARDQTLAKIKPTASAVDAREAWVNRQITAMEKVVSAEKLDTFLRANSATIDALEPDQRAAFDRAANAARRRLSGMSAPASSFARAPVDLDDEIPF